jgi:hypothetical protein
MLLCLPYLQGQEYKNIKQFNNQWGKTEAMNMEKIGEYKYLNILVTDAKDTTYYDNKVLHISPANESKYIAFLIKIDSLNNYVDHKLVPIGKMEVGDNKIFIKKDSSYTVSWSGTVGKKIPLQMFYIYNSELDLIKQVVTNGYYIFNFAINDKHLYLNGETLRLKKDNVYKTIDVSGTKIMSKVF